MVKKLLSVTLAVLMLLSLLPVSSLAAEEKNSFLYDSLLDDNSYYHLEYVEKEDYFDLAIKTYTLMGLYDDAWANYFTGEVDVDYAKTVLIALIEKVEAEYGNQTYEEILAYLKGASSVAELITRVNEYTDLLEFAESNEWATSISVLNSAISVLQYGNELYEKYVEGYALILSVQAANIYYSDLLQYLVDNRQSEDVKIAAADLLVTVNETQEEAVNDLLKEMAADTAHDAAMMGINFALDAYSVTAAIKGAYNFTSSVADKLFNTSKKYEYISSLVSIYYVEKAMTGWFKDAYVSEVPEYKDFAVSSMITIRRTGEDLLAGYGCASDTEIADLFNKYDGRDIVTRTSLSSLKLTVMKTLFASEVPYDVTASVAVKGPARFSVRDGNNDVVILNNNPCNIKTDDGAFVCIYNEDLDEYLKVAYLFGNTNYFVNLYSPEDSLNYVIFDSARAGSFDAYYTCISLSANRTASIESTAYWFRQGNETPVYSVSVKNGSKFSGNMQTVFDTEPSELSELAKAEDTTNNTVPVPVTPDENGETSSSPVSFFKQLSENIRSFFERVFGVFNIVK